jgi:hypothetical protein
MAIPRPRKGLRWLFVQTQTYDILIAIFAAIVGFPSVVTYAAQGRRGIALAVALGTIGVLAITAVKQLVGLAAARRKESTHELDGCLYTLHAVLAPGPGCRLRLAIHVPVGDMLEQVTDYIGDTPRPGRVGQQYPANTGIIGKSVREKETFVARRVNDDYEAYVRELVTDWNYTERQARRINPGAMEWMAAPIYDPARDRVDAVLFLDVNQRGFFTAERQELVLAGLSGIALFVGRRYA